MTDDNADIYEINFKFPLRISLLVFLVAVVLDVLYYIVTGSIDKTLIFIGATAAGSGTILTAFYSAKVLSLQLSQNTRSRSDFLNSLEIRKKENAIQYGARWTDPNMQKSRHICREIANLKGNSLDEIKIALDSEAKRSDVFHLLNFFEEMAIGIKYGTINEEMIKEQFEESLLTVWKSLHLWVDDYKKDKGLNEAWILTESLCKAWDQ